MNDQWPYVDSNLRKILNQIIKSNKFNYHTGKFCKLFENKFAKYHGNKYALCISNATIGLELALISLNISKKDEVIVTARSYYTSVSCISRVGAKPVFADISDNLTISPNDIEKKITKKTKAIICVHISGIPCDMNKIIKIAKKNKLKVIEDCSQAHGAKINKKLVGTFGDISVWSFCNDKIISTLGEGGMISTNKLLIAKKLWSLKDNGKNYDKFYNQSKVNNFKYVHDYIGTNARMTELQAAAGIYQLNQLNNYIDKRNTIAKMYDKILSKSSLYKAIPINLNNKCAYYKFPFYIDLKKTKKNISYQIIMNYLGSIRNGVTVGCCPDISKELQFKGNKSILPNAEKISKKLISLSINHRMKINEVIKDANRIKSYFDQICI